MPVFTTLNKFLQRETPCVHWVHDKLQFIFSNVLSKFVKVSVIRDAKDRGKLENVDFQCTDNQLSNSNLFIGFTTRQVLQKLLDEGEVSD